MFDSGDLDLPDPDTTGQDTGLRLHEAEPWPVVVDRMHPAGHGERRCHVYRMDAAGNPVATLRRIGWLDQRGRVWLKIPSTDRASQLGCGSFTPLLIDPGERS